MSHSTQNRSFRRRSPSQSLGLVGYGKIKPNTTKARIHQSRDILQHKIDKLEMWANAQRDGRPAEYRWRPLFNAAVWLTPQSSPYCKDMWGWYYRLDTCLSCEDIVRQSCAMVRRWRLFASFLCPVFPASRVQHISDLHSKFALRPHHV